MSVTELRDDQANEWREWARRNPDAAREHNKARRIRYAQATADAPRNGEPWTPEDFAEVMHHRPLIKTAFKLGRTYSSCVRARQRARKMQGLGASRMKGEADPYDGADVPTYLYAKEKK